MTFEYENLSDIEFLEYIITDEETKSRFKKLLKDKRLLEAQYLHAASEAETLEEQVWDAVELVSAIQKAALQNGTKKQLSEKIFQLIAESSFEL